MVLESLITPFKAGKKPWEMFFFGLLYCTVAIFLSLWIFESYSTILFVFFTVLVSVPLVYSTFKLEEGKDLQLESGKAILKEHAKALSFLMFLFMGITLAVTLWYLVLPAYTVSTLFKAQTDTIVQINSRVTGNAAESFSFFSKIFFLVF